MSTHTSRQVLHDATSYAVPISNYDTQGFCKNYPLRRHKWEAEANAGCHEARLDWAKYIGFSEEFGGANPINGQFAALALPLIKPERIGLVVYTFEYAYLYDTLFETDDSDRVNLSPDVSQISPQLTDLERFDLKGNCHDHIDQLMQHARKRTDPALGRAQIEAKIMMRLEKTDPICFERIKRKWKQWTKATQSNKDKQYDSLEEYLDFRLIDVAAYWVEALMLFGMGVTLTKEEDTQLEHIRRPCFLALGLVNDYISFDREYSEFIESGKLKELRNAVWLHMQLHQVDVDVAKEMVRDITQEYERQFLESCKQLQEDGSTSEKLKLHLDGLMYQISGNLVWSLNAPRYHPDARYDPNAGLEDGMTAKSMPATLGIDYNVRLADKANEDPYRPSRTRPDPKSLLLRKDSTQSLTTLYNTRSTGCLDSEHVEEPLRYIKSLPSKGVREAFIDALNSWVSVPASNISRIKSVGNRLHCASLVLDDIEDGSSLRRGQPATHTVFGTAQTINSGCYEILKAVEEAQYLGPKAVKIVLEELDDLHIGQSYDLYWTQHNLCPSEDEYLEMVTKKTGGVFRLITRLLLESSETKASDQRLITDIEHLVRLIGIQYQIRDDYQNLYCKVYSEKKGFCQDLDEGKFSFPLIHALSAQSDGTKLLRELLQRRRDVGHLSYEQKMLVLKQLDCVGSMAYTRDMLKWLEGEVYEVVNRIEGATKIENWVLRALLHKLEI